jgi:hypothetical protein
LDISLRIVRKKKEEQEHQEELIQEGQAKIKKICW